MAQEPMSREPLNAKVARQKELFTSLNYSIQITPINNCRLQTTVRAQTQ